MIQSEIYDIEAYMQIGQEGYQFLKKIAPLTQENQWQLFSEEGGFKIHIRPDPETGLCLTRGEGFLPYTVDEIFAIIEDIPIRPKYDGICESGQIIRRFSDELMLFYQKFKSMFFVISSRDFVVISRKIVEGDFTYAIGKSLEHPNHPPVKGVVRGDLKIGGWILEKREGGTFCIFVTWADPKGMLPKKAVNIVAGAQGKVVQQIKLLLDERKKNVNK
ncbi:unnamed protein product [Paramecium octaurelia]|uniref:START domain-containing protein n=2 Tax=Paramecium TaxID=5884 RepID=A0A8S1SHR0_PAROT|nr:unnamed protein product [Paramecium octaurelia]